MHALHHGWVMHRRYMPRSRHFRYRVFGLLLDVDRLDEPANRLRLFSRNRFNLVSFHDQDHGACTADVSLRAWAEALLRQHGLEPEGGSIHLLCFPRILGYGFNPLAVWYCRDAGGQMQAVILEVRNTFGEKHQYLISCAGRLDPRQAHVVDKQFHVSPFIGMDARYRFRLTEPDARPGGRFIIRIEESSGESPLLLATHSGTFEPLTDAGLLWRCLAVPFLGLRIMALIHWQALRLWLGGFPFQPRPPAPDKEVTSTWTDKTESRR